jgi:hypothetical protein
MVRKESTSVTKLPFHERRKMDRRKISYYMPIMDSFTKQLVGHLMNLSPIGLMMDSNVPIPPNQKFNLHIDLMEEIAGHASLEFVAYSIWCQPDPIQPFLYNAGFIMIDFSPGDLEVINQISEKYGED